MTWRHKFNYGFFLHAFVAFWMLAARDPSTLASRLVAGDCSSNGAVVYSGHRWCSSYSATAPGDGMTNSEMILVFKKWLRE